MGSCRHSRTKGLHASQRRHHRSRRHPVLSVTADDPVAELDRQLATLIDLGLPAAAGVTAATLRRRTSPLRDHAAGLAGSTFVLVLPGLLAADRLVTLARMGDRPGFTTMDADDLASFRPTKDVELPAGEGATCWSTSRPATTA